jgi:hypothetical protein
MAGTAVVEIAQPHDRAYELARFVCSCVPAGNESDALTAALNKEIEAQERLLEAGGQSGGAPNFEPFLRSVLAHTSDIFRAGSDEGALWQLGHHSLM